MITSEITSEFRPYAKVALIEAVTNLVNAYAKLGPTDPLHVSLRPAIESLLSQVSG